VRLHCRAAAVDAAADDRVAERGCQSPLSTFGVEFRGQEKEEFVVKLRLRDNESIQDAVKRFRKLVEHAGIKKEMRRREYYEKPSDTDRRARRRAERRARMSRLSR
jgi:small subunit ribosomal protein S21